MPFYEYECASCKFYTEVMQKLNDAPLKKCPSCGKPTLRKLISAPVFRLKGGGWYETDFKSDSESKRNLAGGDDAPDTKAADSKPEAKPADTKGADTKAADSKPEAKPAEKASSSAAKPTAKPAKAVAKAPPRKPAAKPKAKAKAKVSKRRGR
jgi:putative FmdB family regulatory protein